ncbi:MAG: glycosyltransferase family 39 protein [PVC group bacterium]
MRSNSASTKVFLVLLLLAAFLIRLWGLLFDQGEMLFNNDASRLYLRWAQRFYGGLVSPARLTGYWHNICYPFFAQYLMGAACWIYAGFKYAWSAFSYLTMTQPFPFTGELSFTEQIIICRLLQVLLSTGLVYLIYRLGLNLLGRETALVGAFLTAFMPQIINHSRYLQSDITVTFFVTATVLFSSYILTRGDLKWYLLAGLAAGLSVGAKHNGALALIAPLGAHLGRTWACRKGRGGAVRHGRLLGVFLCFLLGVGISYPVIWLDWSAWRRALPRFYWMQLITDKRETVTHSFWHHRVLNFRRFFTDTSSLKIGTGVLILVTGLLGAIKAFKTRKVNELFLVFFPLAYLLAVIVFRGNVRHKDFLPGTVFIPLISAFFIVTLIRKLRLPGRLQALLIWILAAAIALPAVVSDVRVAYCCWQRDTRLLSGDWIWENIPPGSRIARERYCPHISDVTYDVAVKPRYLCLYPLESLLEEQVEFLVSSSTAYGRFFDPDDTYFDEKAQEYYRELDRRFLVKTFRFDNTGFIDGVIKVYYLKREKPAWEDKASLLRDLDFAYSDTSPVIMTLENNLAYTGKSGFWVEGKAPVERLVIAPEKLERIGLLVFPAVTGSTLQAVVGGEERKIRADDLDPKFLVFRPRTGFPFIDYLYRIRARAGDDGERFLIKIVTDPVRLARYAGSRARDEERAPHFDPEHFDEAFRDRFGEDTGWWREKYTRVFECEGLSFPEGRDEDLGGSSGGRLVTYRPERDETGCFVWGPYVNLPPQPWIASFRLRAGEGGTGKKLAKIEVTSGLGERTLAARELTRADFPESTGFVEFTLPFVNDCLGSRLEFRVSATGDTPLGSDRVTVYPDLPAWFLGRSPAVDSE